MRERDGVQKVGNQGLDGQLGCLLGRLGKYFPAPLMGPHINN